MRVDHLQKFHITKYSQFPHVNQRALTVKFIVDQILMRVLVCLCGAPFIENDYD